MKLFLNLASSRSCSLLHLHLHTSGNTCNEYPPKPHFYIVKLGYAGVYIFSYFCSKTFIECWYSIEPPRRDGFNVYPQSIFLAKIKKKKKKKKKKKYQHFFQLKIFNFSKLKTSLFIAWASFRNDKSI